jgi:hypothetical protein
MSANQTLRSICVTGLSAAGSLMIVSGILLLLSTTVLLVGVAKVCCTFTPFHIW